MMTVRKTPKSDLPNSSNSTVSYPVLESHLRCLKLPGMLAEYAQTARRCSTDNVPYEKFLEELANIELHRRESNAIARRINAARVPAMKELADFDFAAVPSLNKAKVLELAQCAYVHNHTNVVLAGPPGVGKPQPPQYTLSY